jgi:hypothetical protein
MQAAQAQSREALQGAWKQWVEEHGACSGSGSCIAGRVRGCSAADGALRARCSGRDGQHPGGQHAGGEGLDDAQGQAQQVRPLACCAAASQLATGGVLHARLPLRSMHAAPRRLPGLCADAPAPLAPLALF